MSSIGNIKQEKRSKDKVIFWGKVKKFFGYAILFFLTFLWFSSLVMGTIGTIGQDKFYKLKVIISCLLGLYLSIFAFVVAFSEKKGN